jgi:hypothetical protein
MAIGRRVEAIVKRRAPRMSDLHEDLRSTEESIRRDAQRITALEDRKSALDSGDDRIPEPSEQVVRVANDLSEKAACRTGPR